MYVDTLFQGLQQISTNTGDNRIGVVLTVYRNIARDREMAGSR